MLVEQVVPELLVKVILAVMAEHIQVSTPEAAEVAQGPQVLLAQEPQLRAQEVLVLSGITEVITQVEAEAEAAQLPLLEEMVAVARAVYIQAQVWVTVMADQVL